VKKKRVADDKNEEEGNAIQKAKEDEELHRFLQRPKKGNTTQKSLYIYVEGLSSQFRAQETKEKKVKIGISVNPIVRNYNSSDQVHTDEVLNMTEEMLKRESQDEQNQPFLTAAAAERALLCYLSENNFVRAPPAIKSTEMDWFLLDYYNLRQVIGIVLGFDLNHFCTH